MMAQRLAGGGTGHVLVSLEASLELVGMLAWSSPITGRARGATCSRTSFRGTSVPSYLLVLFHNPNSLEVAHPAAGRLGRNFVFRLARSIYLHDQKNVNLSAGPVWMAKILLGTQIFY